MAKILWEADQESVAVAAKRHSTSEQMIYTWRKRFGKMEASDVERLRELERENGRLKKLIAEFDLQIDVMKEIQATKRGNALARRRQVAFASRKGLSLRRVCAPLSVARSGGLAPEITSTGRFRLLRYRRTHGGTRCAKA